MISTVLIIKIFSTYAGCWALGYGVGKSVAWTRNIANVV